MFNLVCGKSDKKNSGFSLVELIVAIGILGIISVIVGFMMTSSSRNYGKISVEAQLQSEAQLVANAISEYAIDSYKAAGVSEIDIGSEYEQTENKLLVLNATENSVDVQYVIARAGNELYIGERRKDQDNPDPNDNSKVYGSYSFSLLGKNVTDFDVDVSHVESDNIIDFKLQYEKNKHKYAGNYQVLMRNRAYADKEKDEENKDDPVKLVLGLSPKHIYIDIVNGKPGNYYYLNELTNKQNLSLVNYKIPLSTTIACNKSGITNPNAAIWKMFATTSEDDNSTFTISGFNLLASDSSNLNGTGVLSDKAYICLDTTGIGTAQKGIYDNVDLDEFCISASRDITLDGVNYSAKSKTTKVHLRRVKAVSLKATSGVSAWLPIYNSYEKAVYHSEAMGYAYPDQFGRYQSIVLTANVKQKWVPYGEGLIWELYMMNDDQKWEKCNDRSYASLATNFTESSFNNTVNFGTSVKNGQLYRVVVKTKFDDSKQAEYIFGVVPRNIKTNGGYNSRGFFVNLNEYFQYGDFTGLGGGDAGCDKKLAKCAEKGCIGVKLSYGGSSFEDSGIKLTQINGDWYVYLDYSAFKYSYSQKIQFYNQTGTIAFYVYCTKDGNKITSDFKYDIAPVCVHKEPPTASLHGFIEDKILIPRGGSKIIKVQTEYYNIIGQNWLGIYVDNDSTAVGTEGFGVNLNNANAGTNAFILPEVVSGYGDAYNYVDTAVINLSAKNSLLYAANPMTVRVTADDYYNLDASSITEKYVGTSAYGNPKKSYYTSSGTDYTVFVSNVTGRNTFLATPATKINKGITGRTGEKAFPDSVKSATKTNPVDISAFEYRLVELPCPKDLEDADDCPEEHIKENGVYKTVTDASGKEHRVFQRYELVEFIGKAYMEGSKYKCNLDGVVYTYNPTYQYWSN